MTLLQFESQPDFPNSDITDTDAVTLEEILRGDMLEVGHRQAEAHNLLFRVSHPLYDSAAKQQLDTLQKQAAFSGGIRAYEAMSLFMRPQLDHTDQKAAMGHVIRMGRLLTADEHLTVFMDAKGELDETMPRTSQLIAATAFSGYADYAVSGAGIARKVQLAAMNDMSAFESQFPDLQN